MKIPSTEITLGWRNVWKNRRRTILTLLTVMSGCTMIIFMKAAQAGAFNSMIEDAVISNNGHIQIHEKGFWDNMSIDYAIIPTDTIIVFITTFVAALYPAVKAARIKPLDALNHT